MKYLLDTNVISELISNKPDTNVTHFIKQLTESSLYLSVITIGEIETGIQKLSLGKKRSVLSKWLHEELISRFQGRIASLDTETMIIWGQLNQALKSSGKSLPIMDSLIAASCVHNDFVLLTRNVKDFQHTQVEIINPFDLQNR